MSRYFSRRFSSLTPYTPGEQPKDMAYIKLNTNESPFPPSDAVLAAVSRDEVAKLNLYPDPEGRILTEKLAAYYGVQPENVFISNGSDDILNFSFMAFCDQDHGAVFPEISYGFYEVYAKLYGIDYRKIPLKDDFSIDPSDYYDAPGMVVIANPNAPTGLALSVDEIEGILRANPDRVVLIDEAYVDFGAQSCLSLIETYKNLLVVQTYSKSRSLAGARLGFAIADRELIADLNTIKFSTNPYNINRLTLLAGAAAIDSAEYFRDCNAKTMQIREYTKSELAKRGFSLTDSKSNFLFAANEQIGGREFYLKLKENGILVRHFDLKKIENYVRITVGTKEQMDALLAETDQILKNEV